MLQFLTTISTSKYTLPIIGVVCSALWFLFRTEGDFFQYLCGLAASLFVVYQLTELNNRNALLRNASRMLGSLFLILITVILPLHPLSAFHLVLIVYMLVLHALCHTVLAPSPSLVFLLYAMLSCLLLLYPQMLWFIPVFWICQINMRSLTARTFIASLIGLVVPHWLILGWRFIVNDIPTIVEYYKTDYLSFIPDYSQFDIIKVVQLVYIILVLVVGIVDFYSHKNDDKSRVRIIYTTIIIHAFFVFLYIMLQPQHFYMYFTMLVVDSAILGGHFFALTYTRYSHIMAIVFLILTISVLLFSAFGRQITAIVI